MQSVQNVSRETFVRCQRRRNCQADCRRKNAPLVVSVEWGVHDPRQVPRLVRIKCGASCCADRAPRLARVGCLASCGSGVSLRADQAPRAVRRSLRASCLRMFHVKHSFVRNRACRTCGSARGPAFPRLRLSVHNARLASACVNRRPRTPACALRALCAPRPARAYRASLPMASMSYGVVWYT